MTPAARVQAAIEVLDKIIAAVHDNGPPADRVMAEWARSNRYAGSKDRRAVRELVFSAIRVCGPAPKFGREAILRLAQKRPELIELFDGSQYGPKALKPTEEAAKGGIAPQWLVEGLAGSGIDTEEAKALLERAPLDLRVNRIKAQRAGLELPELAPELVEELAAPNALRLPTGTQIDQWPAFREGQIEVQDHGSQWACQAVGAQPGETVIDLCAGAGGKSLALAAAMENSGALIASDTDRGRLSRLAPRAERAGATNIQTVLLNPGHELEALAQFEGQADRVLVDAPCSGIGTWRRNPESRWRVRPKALEKYAATQDRLLEIGASLVKPGGYLIYVTCSLLDAEGPDRIAAFLKSETQAHRQWRADPLDLPVGRQRGAGVRLTPHHDGTDGFFIARMISS